jgi:predicted hotdog family 3-hydroxylacyl-ACP dehydratase
MSAFPPIQQLLPHAGPMRLLERVIAHDAAETRCAVRAGAGGAFRQASGDIPSWAAIEVMAQCAAADGSLRRGASDDALGPALFLGSRRIALHAARIDPAALSRLEVSARFAAGRPGGLLAFDCALREVGGATVAEGRLHVLPVSAEDLA